MGVENNDSFHDYSVDLLKGICAVFIIITHFSWELSERLQAGFPFWIDMAVPVFMIISGYVHALSYKKNKIDSLDKAYTFRNLIPKIIRYTVPYALFFLIEQALFAYDRLGNNSSSQQSFFDLLLLFIRGGEGKGSYYYPVMIQFLFVFPAIFLIIKNKGKMGVWICLLINIGYEIFKIGYFITEETYRLLVFRYIMLISIGTCYAYKGFFLSKIESFLMILLGGGAIVIYSYLGYEPRILTYWTGTSFAASMFIVPIVLFLLTKLHRVRICVFETIGNASYDIFLFQMIWYKFIFEKMYLMIDNWYLMLASSIIICISGGVGVHFIEQPIMNYCLKKIKDRAF